MHCQRLSQKLILAGLLAVAFTGLTVSASIQNSGNDVVWKNSDWDVGEAEIQCNQELENVTVADQVVYDEEANVTLNTTDFDNVPEGLHNVTLNCGEGNDRAKLSFFDVNTADLEVDEDERGVGFVGEKMEQEDNGLGNSQEMILNFDFGDSGYSLEDFSSEDFSMSEGFNLDDLSISGSEARLRPEIESYPEGKAEVNISSSRLGFSKVFELEENEAFVHDWDADLVGDSYPGRDIAYEEVEEDEYEYYLDVSFQGGELPEENPLDDHNFVLTVEKQDENGDYRPVDDEDVEDGKYDDYEQLEILEQEKPEDSDANYKVGISEFSRLDALKAGKYKFILEVKYKAERPEDSDKSFAVDETRVDKSSEFSGIILDAGGNGVKTLMELRGDDTTKNVESDTGGYFSTEIDQDEYDLNAEFYDTTEDTSATPDAEVSLQNVGLEDADLGPGGSAINFNYWNDPDTNVEGLKPVNMMAVKFGYPLSGIDNMKMSFDMGELDPDSIQIYECDSWNFEGEFCMSSWNETPSEAIEVNLATYEAVIDGSAINEYRAEGENILMGAYVIGTSSELALQDSISLDSTSIASDDNLGATGVVVDESGDRVEDADVNLRLTDGDNVEGDWNTTTDTTGSFEFSESINVDDGRYTLELEVKKSPYQSFEIESDETIEVYYETGIDVRSIESSPKIKQGQEDSFVFEISNEGQQPVSVEEMEVTGLDTEYFRLDPESISTVEAGETREVEVITDLPGDYCSYPCGESPNFDISVSGTSNGKEVSSDMTVPTTLEVDQEEENNSGSEQSNTEEENNTQSGSGSSVNSIQNATGDFVQRQSDLNIALALIMIFTMMLAAAVKKKKTGNDRGSRRGRPDVSRPPVATAPPHKETSKVSESEEGSEDNEHVSEDNEEAFEEEGESKEGESKTNGEEGREDEDEESASNVCDICGEEFESETGVKLHKDAVH